MKGTYRESRSGLSSGAFIRQSQGPVKHCIVNWLAGSALLPWENGKNGEGFPRTSGAKDRTFVVFEVPGLVLLAPGTNRMPQQPPRPLPYGPTSGLRCI